MSDTDPIVGNVMRVEAWTWQEGRLMSTEFPWPVDERNLSRVLEQYGFQQEFILGSEPSVPWAAVFSSFADLDDELFATLPYHYLIVLHLGSYFEIILAADLPEMLEATRYIGPVIEQASQ